MDFNKTIDQIISEIDIEADLGLNNGGNWSVRYNPFWRYYRADNNIFAPASTLFILNQLKTHLTKNQQSKIEKIAEKITSVYPKYQNKDGRITYNFYPTKPSKHFANGYLMHWFDHFRLPDDIDDSALIFLTQHNEKHDIFELKNLLKNHLVQTQSGKVYDTWFGKNMPPEQDVCALCNLMYLIFSKKIPLDSEDINTLNFLNESISSIKTQPFKIARHYGHPALIVYHYTRLMAEFEIEILEKKKNELVTISKELLSVEKDPFCRQILEITLMKWGEIIIEEPFETKKSKGYSFIGAPLAPYAIFESLTFKNPFLIFYKSKIHQLAFKLEHTLLSSNIATK